MKFLKNYSLFGLILILSFCLSSCHKDQSENPNSTSDPGKVSPSSSSGGFLNLPLSKDGNFSSNQNNLTELNKYIQIPSWINLNKNAQVIKIETPQSLTLSAFLSSDKSKSETEKYWLDYLKSKGYEQVQSQNEKDNATSINGKKNKENLSVFLDKGKDRLIVNIVYIKAMI